MKLSTKIVQVHLIILDDFRLVALDVERFFRKLRFSFKSTVCPRRMYLTFTLNFEAVTTSMSGILVFPVFQDLHNLILYLFALMA